MSANKLTTPIATINLIACLRFEVAAIGSVVRRPAQCCETVSGYRTSSIRSLARPRALVVVIGRAYACRAGEFTYLTVRTSVEQSQVFLKTDQATIETLRVFDNSSEQIMDWINVRLTSAMSRLAYVVMARVIVLALSNTVSAQNTATVSGVVKDAFDAAVPNADVSLTNSQQVVLKDAMTDAQGSFTFDGIHAGSYVIVVSRSDFNTQRRAVEVTSGQNLSIDILLQVNQISEQ